MTSLCGNNEWKHTRTPRQLIVMVTWPEMVAKNIQPAEFQRETHRWWRRNNEKSTWWTHNHGNVAWNGGDGHIHGCPTQNTQVVKSEQWQAYVKNGERKNTKTGIDFCKKEGEGGNNDTNERDNKGVMITRRVNKMMNRNTPERIFQMSISSE